MKRGDSCLLYLIDVTSHWPWISLLSLVVACGRLGFDPTAAAERAVDARDDGVSAGPCYPWGHSFGAATVSSPDPGIVLIMPSATGQNEGGCIADAWQSFGGLTVDVARTTAAASGYTSLRTGSVFLELRGGELALRDTDTVYAQAAFDPIAMRWWRLRPDTATVAEISADGQTWARFGDTGAPPPPDMLVELVAGVTAMESAPGESMFSHLGF